MWNRYRLDRISEEKPWIRIVELASGGFFVVDYIIKIYRWEVFLFAFSPSPTAMSLLGTSCTLF